MDTVIRFTLGVAYFWAVVLIGLHDQGDPRVALLAVPLLVLTVDDIRKGRA